VFAKRLVRLVLAPGALPYALLVVVIGLIWMGVGGRASPGQSAAVPADEPRAGSAITYRGPPRPNAPLIGLKQAVSNARRFAGEPGLALEGGLQSDPRSARRTELYYLESLGPTRGEDFFKIDARTGEVIEATLRSRLTPATPPFGLGQADAERIAERYARERFYGFADLVLVERSSRPSENNVLHSFKWNQIAADSGAELPISVSIALSAGSGDVVWYLAQRDSLKIDVRPAIDRAQALEAAIFGTGGPDSRWDTGDPVAVRLQVLYDDDNRQQLVWSVTFRARQETSRPTLRVLVNARTGQLIAGPQ